MSLATHRHILREYEEIRKQNESLLKKRQKEVANLCPEYPRICEEIRELSVANALASLDCGHLSCDYTSKLAKLEEERKNLLDKLGFGHNYLDPIYTCPFCKDTGIAANKTCSCYKKKEVALLYQEYNLKNIVDKASFKDFDISLYPENMIDKDTKKSAKQLAYEAFEQSVAFVQNFDTSFSNLLFLGDTGLGKTFLSTCIAKKLMEASHSVIYLTATDLFDELGKFEDNKHILECDLLIIDDLGSELTNSFTASKLFYCLNDRLLRKKSTIISTNLDLIKLSDYYTERVFSRLVQNYTFLKLAGNDIRTKR